MSESSKSFLSLFENNSLPTLVVDRNTFQILATNKAAQTWFESTGPELLRKKLTEIATGADFGSLLKSDTHAIEPFGARQLLRQRKKDGVEVILEVILQDITFEERQSILVTAIGSAPQRLAKKLPRPKDRFSKAFQSCPIALAITTREDPRFVEANDAFLRLVGRERAEVIDHACIDVMAYSDPDLPAKIDHDLRLHNKMLGIEAKFQTKNGGERNVSLSAQWLELDQVPCVLTTYSDMTETKLLEDQLRQAQKMEAVGRLAGGVAHDFNNVLGVIMGYCDLLLPHAASLGSTAAYVGRIRKASERAAALTRRMLTFSRQRAIQPKFINLNLLVSELNLMLPRLLGENIELVLRLGENLGGMKADPGQIEQLIINLAVNARDAMPQGGKLYIETANRQLQDADTRQLLGISPGPYVLLQVTDTGLGIQSDILPYIFEPFFTTKNPGKGTGLGLAIAYGVVKQSGGNIWVYSDPGRGTTFKIFFPQVEETSFVSSPAPPLPAITRGSETILLVEDDEPLRELTAKLLESGGYTVLEAHDASQAMDIAGKHAQTIDLLLTDLVLPGIGGEELAEILRFTKPSLPVLYTSGYAGEFISQSLEADAPFLEKPYTQTNLLRQVRGVLDAK